MRSVKYGLCLSGLLLCATPNSAQAATIQVNVLADQFGSGAAGECSLREAAQSFNNGAAFDQCSNISANPFGTSDQINIIVAGTITLTGAAHDNNNNSGDIDIAVTSNSSLSINGQPTTINANNLDRIFD